MSIHTNDLEETERHWFVDDRTIVAREVGLRHPSFEKPDVVWRQWSGAELWGFLRVVPVFQIYFNEGAETKIVLWMRYAEDDDRYITMSWAEFFNFLTYNSSMPPKQTKRFQHCWHKEGF